MTNLDALVFTAADGSCRVWYLRVAPQLRRVAAQALRRQLLARTLGLPPQSLLFAAETGKKPRLLTAAAVDFSVAYGPAALAIGIQQDGLIGVDTTPVDPAFGFGSVVDAFFTKAEAAYVAAVGPELQPARFARLWTRKEAYLKATGLGVAGLDQRLEVLAPSLLAPPRLYLYDLDLGAKSAAALCVASSRKYDLFTTEREVLTLD